MVIVGYSDRLSVTPGQTIRFMVSSKTPAYEASIVALQHGDVNPAGPGFKARHVRTSVDGRYRGREQRLRPGSYVRVHHAPALGQLRSFSLVVWVYPTMPRSERQGLVTQWANEDSPGYGLFITEVGDLELVIRDTAGRTDTVRTGQVLDGSLWYFVAATFDKEQRVARLYQIPAALWPGEAEPIVMERRLEVAGPHGSPHDLLMGAWCLRREGARLSTMGHFNGKLDGPCLVRRALIAAEIEALQRGMPAAALGDDLVAAWDFSRDITSDQVHDICVGRLSGVAVNLPTRAVTGHNWTGQKVCFEAAPEQYGAIHFHDDDLEDAGWEPDFELTIQAGMRSGVYAVRLATGSFEDYVPFFVRPAPSAPRAPALFLVPTLSYLAYGNEHLVTRPERLALMGLSFDELVALGTPYEQSVLRYMTENRLLSLYEQHRDGSGVCYGSRLRPLVNMRPRYNKPALRFQGAHQFNEDLYLVDWLKVRGYDFDVATDEDLHAEGTELLRPYRVVMTGSHPEYWTGRMLDGLEAYLQQGGRLMYLGGNGFYWVTSVDAERPHVIEVRRAESGVRTWQAAPGEYYHSTTGELGGLWRFRGRAPQRLVGIGFSAAGSDRASPYWRQPGSFDPRAKFIFEGIGPDEVIGDFGLHLGGAAGWELDRADPALGTPRHALVLASSFGHSDAYLLTVEEVWKIDGRLGGTVNPLVRADMVYFECPNGGAVFSVGSISWCGSLSHNGYENNVSRITENVLKRFIHD